MSKVDAAVALRKLGWNVVAAAPRGKIPVGSWKRWQSERVPERMVRETFSQGDPNVFVITGAVSRLTVLDCDDPAAEAYWRNRLGDILDATTQVRTGQGAHFYFRLAEGQSERGRSSPGGDAGKWDLRAEGGGVVAPPSVHPTGRMYEWVEERGPGALQDAPPELFERGAEGDPGEGARSLLSHLLGSPPEGEGGRNMWLAKVAGHYALHIPHQDAYELMVREAADKLQPPLPEHEISKLVHSIWQSEQAKVGHEPEPVGDGEDWRSKLANPEEDTGWLVSGGTRILVQIRKKLESGGYEKGLSTWLDCDVRVLGVVESEVDRVFHVEVRRPNGRVVTDSLPSSAVTDQRRRSSWLARHGASVGVPDEIWPIKMRDETRLLRYLEAQEAPSLEAIPYLGWHDESQAFVTHGGIIRSDGPAEFEAIRPEPAMVNWAKYRYGHEPGVEQARDVLRRVLEFHDEEVASVFGAWWAAALLKPQIMRAVSQFPFMALEAASESGKTTGFFNLMMQLSGHYGGQANPTTAALRDALSANRSGIVWVDDLDDLERHGELLRQVTVGGSLIKKGGDAHTQITAQMRSALVISGEGLGLHGQKALTDRAVMLSVPSPVGRLNRGGRAQWEDILELNREYPDLTELAGGIVQLALQQEHQIRDIKRLRRGSGRFADKNAIIRLGGRILAAMTQENWMVEYADDWALTQQDPGSENALTLNILPEILRVTGRKPKPEGSDEARSITATPAFVEITGSAEIVWFSPTLVADWLRSRGRRSVRLETRQALEDQARALGLGGGSDKGGRQFRFSTGGGKARYWQCPPALSKTLIARSEGDEYGDEEAHGQQDRIL